MLNQAIEYYQKHPRPQVDSKKRRLLIKKLLFLIETAPFLSNKEKSLLKSIIYIYPTETIDHVRINLLQQGIIFLHMNPEFHKDAELWLDKSKKPL